MKRTCEGCKALCFKDKYEQYCLLSYKMDGMKLKPLEDCPKPTTNMDFINCNRKENL